MFLGFPGGSDGKESACKVGDLGSILELGRSSGGGHGNPLLPGESPWTEGPGRLQFMQLQSWTRLSEHSAALRHSYTGFGLDMRFQLFSEAAV